MIGKFIFLMMLIMPFINGVNPLKIKIKENPQNDDNNDIDEDDENVMMRTMTKKGEEEEKDSNLKMSMSSSNTMMTPTRETITKATKSSATLLSSLSSLSSSASSSSDNKILSVVEMIQYDTYTLFRILGFISIMFLTIILVWFIPYSLQILFRNVLRWEISFDSDIYRQYLLQYYILDSLPPQSIDNDDDEISIYMNPDWENYKAVQLFLRTNIFQFFYMLLQLAIFFSGLVLGFLVIKEDFVAILTSLGLSTFIALLQISIYFSNAFAYGFALVTAYIRLGDVMDIPGSNQKGIVVEMGFIHTKFVTPSDYHLKILKSKNNNSNILNNRINNNNNNNNNNSLPSSNLLSKKKNHVELTMSPTTDSHSTTLQNTQANPVDSLMTLNALSKRSYPTFFDIFSPLPNLNKLPSPPPPSSSSPSSSQSSLLSSSSLSNNKFQKNKSNKYVKDNKKITYSNHYNNNSPYINYLHMGKISPHDIKVGKNMWIIKTVPNYSLVFNPGNTWYNRHY